MKYSFYVSILLLAMNASIGLAKEIKQSTISVQESVNLNSFDVNQIYCITDNNGSIVSHQSLEREFGLNWPVDDHTRTIFSAGPWFSGKVNEEIRTSLVEFASEFVPGPWNSNPEDNTNRIYKINLSDMENPDGNIDFANWPVYQGAPWIDKDGDGIYNPLPQGIDHPEFLGEQVLYYVMQDCVSTNILNDPEILGLEVRVTIWGYNKWNIYEDIMFVKLQIFNKGGNYIEDMNFGFWTDTDLGDPGDDLIGCDSTRSLGFCYNRGSDSEFGDIVPSVGVDLLQVAVPSHNTNDKAYGFGMEKDGFINLPMTSFMLIRSDDREWDDPWGSENVHNALSGLHWDGAPVIDPNTGRVTRFAVPGNPSENIGLTDSIWVDGDYGAEYYDRRMLLNAGPFNFNPGDSAEIVLSVLHAKGSSTLNSVDELKEVSDLVQRIFNTSTSIEDTHLRPDKFSLTAFPNPFNPSTTIEYELPERSDVSLVIYDISGREVMTLVNQNMNPGSYETSWNGTDCNGKQVAAGMYFARLKAGENAQTIKMVYLR